jgi:hypothetical protein
LRGLPESGVITRDVEYVPAARSFGSSETVAKTGVLVITPVEPFTVPVLARVGFMESQAAPADAVKLI